MGLFYVDVVLSNLYNAAQVLTWGPIFRVEKGPEESLRMLVDTGATYSVIPAEVEQSLRLSTVREQTVELAGGMRVTRPLVALWMRVDTREAPSLAIVWGGQPVLGAIALEGLGLGVDPVHKRLVPVEAFLG